MDFATAVLKDYLPDEALIKAGLDPALDDVNGPTTSESDDEAKPEPVSNFVRVIDEYFMRKEAET